MEPWYPLAEVVSQPTNGGAMAGGPVRVVWHTTESDPGSIEGATNYLIREGTFPHLIWDPSTGEVKQFCSTWVAAKALMHSAGTPETNRAGQRCIQIEVIGRAAQPFTSRPPLKGLGDLLKWLDTLEVPHVHPATNARMSWDEWAKFGGHCGHVHVPGNDHVDPGAIDFSVLSAPTFKHVEDDMRLIQAAPPTPGGPSRGIFLQWGSHMTHIPDEPDVQAYLNSGIPLIVLTDAFVAQLIAQGA